MPTAMATAPQAPPPAQLQPMPTQPRRALYNKDDISSDPPSDEQRKKKSKDKLIRASSPEKPAPKKVPSNVDPKIEAAFNHCRLGKYHEVEKALQDGVQVDSRFGPDDNTMLLVSAQNGQKRIAKLLLRNFASMNAQNDKGDTAMHLCYKFNYKELGEYLKSKGADDTIQNAKGQTCYQAKK
jgi:ankyrin repeat protein